MGEATPFASKGALTVVFPDALSERAGRETLVVTGSPRGGTSAIAYALRRLDYVLGERVGANNHEDLDFLDAFNLEPARKRKAALGQLIAARNAVHSRWGFKLPKAALHLAEFAELARDPVGVIIYRNPLAVGRSIVNRGPKFPQGSEGLLKGVAVAAERMRAASDQLLAARLPAVLIDFDRFREDARGNLVALADLLALDADGAAIDAVARDISKPGYKKIPG
ncbi:hypothetical protein GGD81_000729 [Rhodobium orientis]|uniref:Sulfotransferase family protein n=1 Tax=Rhodobium orientis TaxID=34017 RepID=A0A327JQ27_9HYPH|nr:hypothetical protein [Rhodobium orientis]MBB4301712.1 hypothetical protein [Rhodobium orientis]MBK5950515.1 hypothetical protein [Rhodobium orientis]RAI28161.1 hypothetical protein CH339_07380 [Rhodobium orientis]